MKPPLVYRPLPLGTYDRNPEWFAVTREMVDVLLGPTREAQDAARKAYRKLMDAPAPRRKTA